METEKIEEVEEKETTPELKSAEKIEKKEEGK